MRIFQNMNVVKRLIIGGTLFFFSVAHAVIGGITIDISTDRLASHVVALQMSEVQSDGRTRYYKGSAVLIGPNLLLTAGHNVAYIPDPSNVVAIFSSTPCWGSNLCKEKRIAALTTTVHPLFRQVPGGTENDLALIKLATNAPSNFKPISVIEKPYSVEKIPLTVLGFGKDTESNDSPLSAFRLRKTSLSFVDELYRFGTKQKFWLAQNYGGICGGDSGGPAVVFDEHTPVVVGIATHVIHKNGQSFCLTQGAFADVLSFSAWVREATAQLRDIK